jgi:hypothetical protein
VTAPASGPVEPERPVARAGRALLALRIGGIVLLTFPTLAVVEAVRAAGHPLATLIYIFGVWALVILAAAIVHERRRG